MKKLLPILAYFFPCWRGFALKGLLLGWCFFCGATLCFAQQYPVVGSFFIPPPYPANWSDYTNPNLDKLRLQLTLTDITVAQRRAKLRLTIKYQNKLLAQSVDNPQGVPMLFLEGGMPHLLTGTELAAYFMPENLVGMSSVLFSQTLAEGLYSFSFEVLDYYTNNRLSADISQNLWILLNDPPLLNMPLNGEVIKTFNPMSPQLIFQWTARSTQASQTEYVFTLTELWDAGSNPAQEFLSAIPLYQTTTFQTTLIYGIAEPPLQLGKKYAWRVQARAKSGFEQIGLFRQDGYSAINMFQYGGGCEAPIGLTARIEESGGVGLRWQAPMQEGASYSIAIRRTIKQKPAEWTNIITAQPEFVVRNVEPGTEYGVRVGLNCPTGVVSFGQEIFITTPKEEIYNNPHCGEAPKIDLSNRNLIESLKVGDVVMGNDFPITLLSVSGDKNGWTGEGWMAWTWLKKLKIKVKYANIQVNTDKRLIKGFFETTYEPKAGNIVDIDKTIADIKGIIDDIKKMLQSYDGSEQSRAAAAQAHEHVDEQYAALVESPYLSPAEKEQLTAMHKETEHCWKALAEGKTCDSTANPATTPTASGPNIDWFFAAGKPNYDCFTQQAEKEADNIQALADKAAAAEKALLNAPIACVCHSKKDEWKLTTWFKDLLEKSPCENVLAMLEKLKAASTAQPMAIKTNSDAETLLIITPCLRIGGEDFEEFRIVFFPQYMFKENQGEYRFSFDKKDLQDYKDVMLDQHGLAHYNKEKNRSDLMLLITAADDNSYQRKLKALKAYLGIGGGNDNDTSSYTPPAGAVPISTLQLSAKGIQFVKDIEEDGKCVLHVYNDFKPSSSNFCLEHYDYNGSGKLVGIKSGHKTNASWPSHKCNDEAHFTNKNRNQSLNGYGNPTVGFGHLISTEKELLSYCSENQGKIDVSICDEMLLTELKQNAKELKAALPKDAVLTQCQFDALVSIVFNRGIGKENGDVGFKSSPLYRYYLKDGKFNDPRVIENIRVDNSNISGGIRRKAEANLYEKCKY